jgi:hypothetical protein
VGSQERLKNCSVVLIVKQIDEIIHPMMAFESRKFSFGHFSVQDISRWRTNESIMTWLPRLGMLYDALECFFKNNLSVPIMQNCCSTLLCVKNHYL